MNNFKERDPNNIIELDFSKFSKNDLNRVEALGVKQKLLYRWFRFERVTEPGLDQLVFYSGARGRVPYAAYRVDRHRNGLYALVNHRTGETITKSRTLNSALNKLPDDFYYST
ncbi:MAG: hypothetical protein VX780_02020 [Pseudomonadota bacterium]|nr:hypothetical protein [Pseudomonadota bacterium]